MKHVIIGTAGHVDHGKTQLVKALTGIDTDRLAEEKKRGITIELGFAHIEWPDGVQAGIVDVPGHEKFIRNMLMGAGGVDLGLLVVAADEGVMPQTVEHLNILSLLGLQNGLVALTKCDLVEPDWLEMVREDVREQVKGTFLEDKPILAVSSVTGQGLPELREQLHTLVCQTAGKQLRTPFRLPVDRVFSVDGFGTVVTGTLVEGCVCQGDAAALAPSGAESRVRTLQVHGQDVQAAYAGQRVAINLAGLKKSDVHRGDAVVRPGSVRVSRMLDVRLRALSDSSRVIETGMQVHLYHGAAVLLCKVVLLDREALQPGESCYAQLRLTEPLAVKNGDRFVIRFFSPLETIGGGVVLDDAPLRHRRGDAAVLEALRIRESGSVGQRVLQALERQGVDLPDLDALARLLSMEPEELEPQLRELLDRGRAVEPLPARYAAAAALDGVWETCRGLLEAYHRQNPLQAGMKAAELRQKSFRAAPQAAADAFLQALCREGRLRRQGECYALADFTITLTKRQTALRDRLLAVYRAAGVEPAGSDEVLDGFEPKERADARQVLESLISQGELVQLTPQLCVARQAYLGALQTARAWFDAQSQLTLAQFRDALGTSRKFAMALLDHFDRCRYTRLTGEVRVLDRGFGGAPAA